MRPETLQELADSIKAQGVVQPIVVRPLEVSDGAGDSQRYEIIAGERRWRAAQMAGLAEIPAVIRDIPDEAAIAVALIENIQRENLNPLEEARALSRLISEFGVTHQQAADAVGRSRASVSNLLRLLELAPEVWELLEKRALEMGHARALLALTQRRQQSEVALLVAKKGLSVRETEALVRRLLTPATSGGSAAATRARSQRRAPRAGTRREARRPGRDPGGLRRPGQARRELQQPGRARRDPGPHPVAAGRRGLRGPVAAWQLAERDHEDEEGRQHPLPARRMSEGHLEDLERNRPAGGQNRQTQRPQPKSRRRFGGAHGEFPRYGLALSPQVHEVREALWTHTRALSIIPRLFRRRCLSD